MKFDGLHVNLLEHQEFHWESISQQDVKCEPNLTKPKKGLCITIVTRLTVTTLMRSRKCLVSKETKQNIFARFLFCFHLSTVIVFM